jgi:mannose-6-phosphate isomerase-like protein (cupin superfamily)
MRIRRLDLDDDSAYLPFAETSATAFDPRDQGRNVELISGRLSGSADLNIGIMRLDPGERHISHRHPRGDEFYVFLSGHALVAVDGEEQEAERGTVVFVPAEAAHAVTNLGEQPVDVLYGLNAAEYADAGLEYEEP